jgi:hypothetical protein
VELLHVLPFTFPASLFLLLSWFLAGLLELYIDPCISEVGIMEACSLYDYLSTASAASAGLLNSTKAKSFLCRSLRLTEMERIDPYWEKICLRSPSVL